MNDQFMVRAASKDDFARWEPLWDGYNAFYGREGKTALPPDVSRMTWTRFFDSSEPMHALVAEESGTLLGLAHFLFLRLSGKRIGSTSRIAFGPHIAFSLWLVWLYGPLT